VSHSFALAGIFNVLLTVTDAAGASDTATAPVSVTSSPRAAFTATPRAVLPGVPIRFDGSNSTVPGGHIILFAWDFGDGVAGQGMIVTHAYVSHGVFSVRLLVRDNFDRTNATQLTVAVGNRAPAITSASPAVNSVLQVGEQGMFTITASDPDSDPLAFSWTIDGVPVGSSSSSYAFMSLTPGAFAIRVIATDGFAATLFEWHVIVEGSNSPVPPPTAGIPETVASLGVIAMGLLVTFLSHAIRSRRGR
jgi:PKD repeat protein